LRALQRNRERGRGNGQSNSFQKMHSPETKVAASLFKNDRADDQSKLSCRRNWSSSEPSAKWSWETARL
jgi:hypothetical protein